MMAFSAFAVPPMLGVAQSEKSPHALPVQVLHLPHISDSCSECAEALSLAASVSAAPDVGG
jgi:hypothetical protein